MSYPYSFTSGSMFTPVTYPTNIMTNLSAPVQPQQFCTQFGGIPCMNQSLMPV